VGGREKERRETERDNERDSDRQGETERERRYEDEFSNSICLQMADTVIMYDGDSDLRWEGRKSGDGEKQRESKRERERERERDGMNMHSDTLYSRRRQILSSYMTVTGIL